MSTRPRYAAACTRLTTFTLALISLGALTFMSRAENQPPAHFTALFNGNDLKGWRGGTTFDPAKLAAPL